jgi:hypothetical protein
VLASTPLWQRLIVLLPAFLIGAGIVFGVLILLGRALANTVRTSGHQRLIFASFVALIGVVAVLTYLGVELPRE